LNDFASWERGGTFAFSGLQRSEKASPIPIAIGIIEKAFSASVVCFYAFAYKSGAFDAAL